MKDYLNIINETYPIRKSKKEKRNFVDFVLNEVDKSSYMWHINRAQGKHNNIIIGNIEEANVIFTAHYDTPATSIIPNLILPRNIKLGLLYHFGFPIILSLISLLISFLISELLSVDIFITIIIYLFLYLGLFFILTKCFKNKHNKNDNTSGVATILSLIKETNNKNIAFILFDNEEKGLLGSKAFKDEYKKMIAKKLFINFDCVGNGNNILFIAKEKAEKHELYDILKKTNKATQEFNVEFFSQDGSFSSSDYKNFRCGIGVLACKKSSKNIYYTNKIHTNKDIDASEKNIEFLVNNMLKFIGEINEKE